MTVTGRFDDGTTRDLTAEATWSSSAPAVALVEADGRLRAVAPGRATLRAMVGSRTDDTLVTVSSATPVALELDPPAAVMPVATWQDFTAVVRYSDGTAQDGTASATWTTDQGHLVPVAGRMRLFAGGLGPGTLRVTLGDLAAEAPLELTGTQIQGVDVTPTDELLPLGLRRPLTASARFDDGTTRDVTAQTVWTSSDPAVAAVSNATSDRGMLTSLALGSTGVTAACLGKEGALPVEVTGARLESLAISGSTTLPKGAAGQLVATGFFSDGRALELTDQVSWVSQSTSVLTVASAGPPRGRAQAKAVGTSRVTATLGSVQGEATVEVTAAALVGLTVEPASFSLQLGHSRTLVARAHYGDGTTMDVRPSATWSSSHPLVARVSLDGVATGWRSGVSVIAAEYGGFRAESTATVKDTRLERIYPVNEELDVALGRTVTPEIRYVDRSGGTGTLSPLIYTMESSDPAAVAVGSGWVKGLVEGGQATITVTYTQLGEPFQTTFLVRVGPKEEVVLRVAPEALDVPVGVRERLRATLEYTDGSQEDVTTRAAWQSSQPGVLGVQAAGPAAGEVEGLAVGESRVSATLGSRTTSIDIRVGPGGALARLVLDRAELRLPVGVAVPVRVRAMYADGYVHDVTAAASWLPLDPAVAHAAGGAITALQPGATVVRVAFQGQEAFLPVTVTAATVQSLALSPAAPRLPAGHSRLLTATARFDDGSSHAVTEVATWISEDPLAVDFPAPGLAEARSEGTTTVRAAFGGREATADLTVTEARMTGLAVGPSPVWMPRGTRLQFWARASFDDGSTLDVTRRARWAASSAAETLAASNRPGEEGLVSALTGPGVEDDPLNFYGDVDAAYGGFEGTASVRIPAAELRRLRVQPRAGPWPLLRIGRFDTTLQCLGEYSDGRLRDLTFQVAWSSDDPTVCEAFPSQTDVKTNPRKAGSTTLRVRHAATGLEGSLPVEVGSLPVVAVDVEFEVDPLPLGMRTALYRFARYEDGVRVPITGTTAFSNRAVADWSGAKVLGKTPGTCDITATDSVSGVSGTSTLTVTEARLLSLAVVLAPAEVPLGMTLQARADGVFSDATRDLSAQVEWSSSHPERVAVDEDGRVTGLGLGEAVLTAREPSTGLVATLAVQGIDARPASLEILPTSLILQGGETSQLTARVTMSDGTVYDGTPSATWSSALACVSVAPGGLATGVSSGQDTVTGQVAVGAWTVSATLPVTVVETRILGTVDLLNGSHVVCPPDGTAWVSLGGTVRAYDLATRTLKWDFLVPGHGDLQLSPDGRRVLVGPTSGSAGVVDVATRTGVEIPLGVQYDRSATWIGNRLVAMATYETLHLFDGNSGARVSEMPLLDAAIRRELLFHAPTGRLFASKEGAMMQRFDTSTWPFRLDGYGPTHAAALSSDGAYLASRGKILDAETLEVVRTFSLGSGWSQGQVVADPLAPRFLGTATSGSGARLFLLDAITGQVQWWLGFRPAPLPTSFRDFAITPDGTTVVVTANDNKIYFLRLR